MLTKKQGVELICLILIMAGSSLAQAISTGVPVMKDGNGQTLGPVIDRGALIEGGVLVTEQADTVIYVDEVPYFLRTFAGGGALFHPGEADFQVFFTDAGCAGTPYIASTFSSFPNVFNIYAVVNDPDLAIYRPVDGATLQPAQVFDSALDPLGNCFPFIINRVAIEAERIGTPFIAPFSIERSQTVSLMAMPFDIPTLSSPSQWLLVAVLTISGWLAGRKRWSARRNA